MSNNEISGNIPGWDIDITRMYSVSHSILDEMKKGSHFADYTNQIIKSDLISRESIPVLASQLLYERLNFKYLSFNLEIIPDWKLIYQKVSRFGQFDIVINYYDTRHGNLVINPFQKEHWEAIEAFEINELVVVSAKSKIAALIGKEDLLLQIIKKIFFDDLDIDDEVYKSLSGLCSKHAGEKPDENRFDPVKKSQPEEAEKTSQKTIQSTIKYKVQVTNELFHNGNVEAWKNILESYQKKYPGNRVTIFYDGEMVNNINSLFKWGKVKVGNIIFFSVKGDNIKEIAKLKQYLSQGASPLFKHFIKKNPGAVLRLF
jgi:hypothetical protein